MRNTLSFITPNYNDGKTLERMVDSIMDQDYKEVEQIIVDDGSTDDSKEIINKLLKKYPDRLRALFLDHQGACIARNEGAKIAKGQYLSFLPADAFLYPGVARIWVEFLDEHPEYGFLYGGYKFTDDNYHEMYSYLSEEFDPYLLEVTNYIDGSFPIRKELFDNMGGWDSSIKSLQDWDFWLNAVKKHGARGYFIRDVFFETTYPHVGGLSFDSANNWIARTDAIKKKYGIPNRKICVTGMGAPFHAKRMAKLLDADYKENPASKPHNYKMIYLIGAYWGMVDGNQSFIIPQLFQGTDAMKVMHWVGTDILQLKSSNEQTRKQILDWMYNNIDVHLCEFEPTRVELEGLGIKARVVPLPPAIEYVERPLPKKFTIACYLPYVNKAMYNPQLVADVMKRVKGVDWKIFGDPTIIGKKDNVEHCGKVEDMQSLIDGSSALLRLTVHDGLPITALEFMNAGRQVITNVDIPHVIKPKSLQEKDVITAINKAKKSKLTDEAREYTREVSSHENYKKSVYDLMEYDPKTYWEQRAELWDAIEGTQRDQKEEYIVANEIAKLNPSSLCDVGCGNGKWYEVLKQFGYTGIDISKTLVEKARQKHPEGEFHALPLENIDTLGKKFDVLFCYTTLLHVKPEKIAEVAEYLRGKAKYLVVVEPVVKPNPQAIMGRKLHPSAVNEVKEGKIVFGVESSFVHDYAKYFNVVKMIDLSPRALFVIEL